MKASNLSGIICDVGHVQNLIPSGGLGGQVVDTGQVGLVMIDLRPYHPCRSPLPSALSKRYCLSQL